MFLEQLGDVIFRRCPDDLLFNLLKQTGHGWTFRLEPRLERGETAFDATVINIAADGDAHAADE